MHFLENGLFSPAQAASRLLGAQQKGDQRLPRQVPEAKFLCFLYIFIARNDRCSRQEGLMGGQALGMLYDLPAQRSLGFKY